MMGTEEQEILKVRIDGIQLKDLLSDEIKQKFEGEMDIDLNIPSMIFSMEEGAIFATHKSRDIETSRFN